MEASSPSASVEPSTGAGNRRKSGRVSKKPEAYSPTGSAKRKRDVAEDGADEDGIGDASDDSQESSEGEPDEEELRERKQKTAKKKKKGSVKPQTKKPKVNGEIRLPVRPVTGKAGKARRPKKAKPLKDVKSAEEAGGLYADVFARGHTMDAVAADWVSQFKDNQAAALANVVNFVLRCAGCHRTVDEHDVEDPDHCAEKLSDLQDEYSAQDITDYPLIAKNKGAASFKQSLTAFFDTLVHTLAASNVLYDEPALIENLSAWVGTMSSAAYRPFRHTATVIALTITSSLCDIGKQLADATAKTIMQCDNEKKKARVNKGRVKDLEDKVKQSNKRQEALDATIRDDWFDTVFVHRYRDVDPRIRVDCAQALGHWIMAYPDLFFDGSHLRYLGWVLSDTNSLTRLEVVKQLQKLFKDKNKLGGLKTFTERFRGRIVEMATRDGDSAVRAATVDLLDILREAGLLEPDDIDSVGRLIFDSEARVRKAVAGFFAANINDLYDSKLEDLGGQEALEEAMAIEGDDDFSTPRMEWLKFKCLAEVLQTYDAEDGDLPSQIERTLTGSVLVANGLESRFSLAAHALYESLSEIQEWEVVAGYVLYDHSGASQNGAADDPVSQLKHECRLAEREETILLEALNASVTQTLTQSPEAGATDKKVKRTKAQREELLENRETAARHLADLIPKLLHKFGDIPDAASAILRLENLLNLDVFQELRQDSETFSALLDDINKQFLQHSNAQVVSEASIALLNAKSKDELAELTEGKVQTLWDDTLEVFQKLCNGKDLPIRGNASDSLLKALTNTVLRLSKLASISDCIELLGAAPVTSGKAKQKSSGKPAVELLTEIVLRGCPTSADLELEPSTEECEDALSIHAMETLAFYLIWHFRYLHENIVQGTVVPDSFLENLAHRRDNIVENIIRVLKSRHGADDVRVAAAGNVLDLYTYFCGLGNVKPRKKPTAADWNEDYMALCLGINEDWQQEILKVFIAAEKNFAKKTGRSLEAADDDEPMDSDEESDDEGEEDVNEKLQAALLAEKKLCELASRMALAITAEALDGNWDVNQKLLKVMPKGPVQLRLERNGRKLGPNFTQVLTFLEGRKEKAKAKSKPKPKSKAVPKKAAKSNEIIAVEDDEDEDEDMRIDDDEDEEALRAGGLVVEEEVNDAGNADDDAGGGAEEIESVMGD